MKSAWAFLPALKRTVVFSEGPVVDSDGAIDGPVVRLPEPPLFVVGHAESVADKRLVVFQRIRADRLLAFLDHRE